MHYRILPYRHSMAGYTDLYELTMGQCYWRSGMSDWDAVFHAFFRANPFNGGYAIACGLESVVDYLQSLRFTEQEVEYLSRMRGNDNKPIFADAYLEYLTRFRFECDVDAMPEGTAVFRHEPLIRVTGPIFQAQLIETALLTFLNFQTLIATKAARICQSARGEPVFEFGARRAQGVDGAFSATRAAMIGGCAGTSNLWAGIHLGLPPDRVKGTMAHSWVMCFDQELDAFNEYARSMPNNCVFLVDTYGTMEGIKHAIEAGRELRKRGYEMIGVRLDSGDLAKLSIAARSMLDQAGFHQAAIMASNELDERLIESLKIQGAAINVWAVGTRLVTGYDDPALGGVYKLAAVRRPGGAWEPKIKLSDQAVKVSSPGILQVRRYFNDAENFADAIYDIGSDLSSGCVIIHPLDLTRQKKIGPELEYTDLLVPVMRRGKLVSELPTIDEIRRHRESELARVSAAVKRFDNPAEYPAWLERSLYQRRTELVLKHRGISEQ
jgi:nicotinate phosphoribosyltransferase